MGTDRPARGPGGCEELPSTRKPFTCAQSNEHTRDYLSWPPPHMSMSQSVSPTTAFVVLEGPALPKPGADIGFSLPAQPQRRIATPSGQCDARQQSDTLCTNEFGEVDRTLLALHVRSARLISAPIDVIPNDPAAKMPTARFAVLEIDDDSYWG